MPRPAIHDDSVSLPITKGDRARIERAAALQQTDIAEFMLRSALQAADRAIDQPEKLPLSDRDTRLWLDLLDHPPEPTSRLIAAARALVQHD